MEDVGVSGETQSKYVFADILAKLMAEDQRAYRRSMIDTKKDENLESLLEYLEQEAKLVATSQSDQELLHKVGIYPLNMNGNPLGTGCCLGCSQVHGLAICPVFKATKVKQRWDIVV